MALILLVIEPSHLISGVRDILELEDYEVALTRTGDEGLAQLQSMERKPDLIITGGISTPNIAWMLSEIRNGKYPDFADIPFITITAKGFLSIQAILGKEATNIANAEILINPFDAEDLLLLVSQMLAK